MTVDGLLLTDPGLAATPGVIGGNASALAAEFGSPNRWLWSPPSWIRSFTLYGKGTRKDATNEEYQDTRPAPAIEGWWFDIPIEPGDLWIFETGDPSATTTGITASTRNTANGGDGAPGEPLVDFGQSGCGASIVSRIPDGGGEEMWWTLGGSGGQYAPGSDGGPSFPVVGAISYGAPTSMSGFSAGGAGTSVPSGGGGGGWPGGAAGGASGAAGVTGGSYLPAASGSSLGGIQSPTFTEATGIAGAPAPLPDPWSSGGSSGGFVIYAYQPVGWVIGAIEI